MGVDRLFDTSGLHKPCAGRVPGKVTTDERERLDFEPGTRRPSTLFFGVSKMLSDSP